MSDVDVLVIGGGAAGLMCAWSAASRGRRVQVLDHANKVGKKILMSGGGRCNFTNQVIEADNYLSRNAHFCKSALSRYTQWDFIDWVEKKGIAYHEKAAGQLFCDNRSSDILALLLDANAEMGVQIKTHCSINSIQKKGEQYSLQTSLGEIKAASLVVATGGLSIPSMGATAFGYELAKQFGHRIVPQRAGLVPFTLDKILLEKFSSLSGLSVDVSVSCNDQSFRESLLFTHRGLSGPAILQVSSYWQPGAEVEVDLLPDTDLLAFLKDKKRQHPNSQLKTQLSELLPKNLVSLLDNYWFENDVIGNCSDAALESITNKIKHWRFKPSGTEGYRTAEVTLGGVDTEGISSKTMESKLSEGLYFVGEVMDVTGHLGGFNFQWAWSSGYAAGQYA